MSKGWKTVKLGDYIQQIRGVSYTPKDLSPELTEEYSVLLRASNIQDILIFDDVQYVHRSKVNEKQYIQKGDILICASSGSKNLVGKAAQAYIEYDACFGAFCKLIRPTK
jgi:type I restriction enzyme S subunit